MKDIEAADLIKIRLKYDWTILLFGFLCLLIQLFFPSNLEFFLILVGAFVFVEILNTSIFRKLKRGGDQKDYYMFSGMYLNQNSSFGAVLFCITIDFFIFSVTSFAFLRDVVKQISM